MPEERSNLVLAESASGSMIFRFELREDHGYVAVRGVFRQVSDIEEYIGVLRPSTSVGNVKRAQARASTMTSNENAAE